MGAYVVLTRLTPEGAASLRADPGRVAAVEARVRALGARVRANYALVGEYDFATVVDAPDNVTVHRIAAEISTIGTVRLDVLPAIAIDRFVSLLRLQPYRTEPHRWQTRAWASLARRAGRRWTIDRHVAAYCRPFDVEGLEALRGFRGPAVIIANHSSHFDTPAVLSALPPRIRDRTLVAAAADKFYGSRKKRTWWYSLFHGTFPVSRGGGMKQLEYPLGMLRRGWSVLIYPEGGRSKSGQVQRFKAGPAVLAMQARVPVIPVWLEGLREIMPKGQRAPRPAPVRVRIGAPVSLEGVTDLRQATERLEDALRALAGVPPHRAHAPAGALEPAPSAAGGGS